ncbi:MAG: ParA family protein [Gammaproteobacteria bacterium]|nr:ParA family protein [Gammaproteobacteria bacterium]
MQDLLRRANSILIPVAPSAIDIHATANFIKELLLVGRVRHRESRIAVVANRVRTSKPVYTPLERFVQSLRIQFLTYLSDSDVYVQAAETGIGVFEMDPQISANEQREFLPIVQWLRAGSAAAHHSNIVPLNQSGRHSGTGS